MLITKNIDSFFPNLFKKIKKMRKLKVLIVQGKLHSNIIKKPKKKLLKGQRFVPDNLDPRCFP